MAGRYVFRDGFEDGGWRWGRLPDYVLAIGLAQFLWLVPVVIGNVSGLRTDAWEPRWTTMLVSLITSFAITLLPAFGEEFSWRGYLLPRLLERFTPRRALLFHGFITWLWHVPFIVTMGFQWGGAPAVSVPLVLAVSLLPTVLHAVVFAYLWSTSGSLLVATVYHSAFDEVRDTLQEAVGFGMLAENWQAVVLTIIGALLLWKAPWNTPSPSRDRFGFWISTLTAIATAVTFVLAVLTLPKSGPFCTEDCLAYPYTDFAAYIPRDFLWMYPALLVAPLFVILLAAMHERTRPGTRQFSRIAIAFGVMAATILTADYVIQLRFVQPAVLKGELDGLAPLTQYNPHGVFIALEEAGYMLMAAAFLFAGLALSKESRLERALRWILVGGFVTVAVSFVVFSVAYGMDVEYRFEVAAITVDWTVLIVASTLLAILYGRSVARSRRGPRHTTSDAVPNRPTATS